jgi:hypothetical protein
MSGKHVVLIIYYLKGFKSHLISDFLTKKKLNLFHVVCYSMGYDINVLKYDFGTIWV